CGHHAISLINGPPHLPASLEREKAYKKGLAQFNIRFKEEYVVNTDLTSEGNEAAISQLLALPDRPSAVVSFNDYVALDVMKIVRNRGTALKQEIHFVSYANYPLWTYIENPKWVNGIAYKMDLLIEGDSALTNNLHYKLCQLPTLDLHRESTPGIH